MSFQKDIRYTFVFNVYRNNMKKGSIKYGKSRKVYRCDCGKGFCYESGKRSTSHETKYSMKKFKNSYSKTRRKNMSEFITYYDY